MIPYHGKYLSFCSFNIYISKANSKKGSSPASGGSVTSNDTTSSAKPKQMSIMAFVEKKKEEALEKRITTGTGYWSPAS